MNTRHLPLQPQDPVAARLGAWIINASVVVTLVMVIASLV